jgi:hypothetical protein
VREVELRQGRFMVGAWQESELFARQVGPTHHDVDGKMSGLSFHLITGAKDRAHSIRSIGAVLMKSSLSYCWSFPLQRARRQRLNSAHN